MALGKQLAVLVTVGSLTPVPLFAASFSGKAYPLAVPGFVAASFLSPDFLCWKKKKNCCWYRKHNKTSYESLRRAAVGGHEVKPQFSEACLTNEDKAP